MERTETINFKSNMILLSSLTQPLTSLVSLSSLLPKSLSDEDGLWLIYSKQGTSGSRDFTL